VKPIKATNDPNAPRAHLNVLFFNDKLELVEGGSSITQVPAVPMGGNMGGFATLTPVGPVTGGGTQACCIAPGPGYAVIYIDNQSIGKDVWFDNIMIEHYTGKVQEESHYYPFGLTMNTSLAANTLKNDIKFQSQRHDDDFGINMYSFRYRDHDPQIGRFWEIDPLAEKYSYNSTYAFSENKVVNGIKLEGLEVVLVNKEKDAAIHKAGTANTDKSAVHIYTHEPLLISI
jgi:RHS repeat-associated protein